MTDLWWWAPALAPPIEATVTPGVWRGYRGVGCDFSEPSPGVVTKVFRPTDSRWLFGGLRTPIRTIEQDPTTRRGVWGRKCQDRVNDSGSGEMSMLNDSPDWEHVQPGDLVRHELDGTTQGAFFVDPLQSVTVLDGAPSTVFAGPGTLSLLDTAPILPALGFNRLPLEIDRRFDYTAVNFEDDGWDTTPIVIADYGANPLWEDLAGPQPHGMESTPASWVGPPGATMTSAPFGPSYYRWDVTLADGTYVLMGTFDDQGQAYFDGFQCYDTGDRAKTSQSDPITVSAGTHVLAFCNWNGAPYIDPESPTIGPCGLIWQLVEIDADGNPGDVVAHSGELANARMVAYPSTAPAMTIGQVMIQVLEEAIDLGFLPDLSWTFDKWRDSKGVPWPLADGEVATKVGYSIGTFFKELSGQHIDMRMWNGAMVLTAFLPDTLGWTKDLTAHTPTDEDDPTSGNIIELAHTVVPARGNVGLAQSQSGWTLVDEAGDDAKRCVVIGAGSYKTIPAVEAMIGRELERYKRERQSVSLKLTPDAVLDAGILVGDLIQVPLLDGTLSTERVIERTFQEDNEGVISIDLELKDLLLMSDERHEQWLEKMANGTVDGTSRVAQPIVTAPSQATCCPIEPTGGG